ncbi:hypothetical protein NLJ89_g5388 [Agrocybe chaxingu]|uniref:DUF6534 domain-containing protein n=1 Tax=Agrocybe chaxingu TaxID=84603 RepID=A0A9W8K1C4_9AGAR|nr:hypothetical protein NLJ89_g5388 [Agrocybe chaxingu]
MAFTTNGLYFYVVTNFGNFEVLLYPTWSMLAGVYLTVLSDLTVRAFFAKRVYILCGEQRFLARLLPSVIIALSLVVFAFAFGFASRGYVLKTFKGFGEISTMFYVSSVGAVTADVVIAVSLCTLLVRSRTSIKRTDSIVTFLMAFTINTGLLMSVCALACLITFNSMRFGLKSSFLTMLTSGILDVVYINSLLASLNA